MIPLPDHSKARCYKEHNHNYYYGYQGMKTFFIHTAKYSITCYVNQIVYLSPAALLLSGVRPGEGKPAQRLYLRR